MARISTYPEISIPGLEDLLIGTDVGNLDQTKNFRLGDIIESLIGPMFVPYLGATGDVNLGAFGITANSFVKAGGLPSQFLKADGSVDSNSYTPQSRFITINGIGYDLSANRSWSIGSIESLSTAGTSGPSTFTEGILNIPEYQEQGSYITQLSGEATGSGPGSAAVTLSNSAVISKLLTGFNTIGGSIASTDTILQAFGKAQSQINSLVSGVSFRGTWNASTNTPALASGVGTGGHYYVVSVAGSTTLNGISSWSVGDWVVFNGVSSAWQRVPNTQLVSSVNGFTGAVSLTSTDVGAAPSSRTITINGVSFDLTANRSWTVGNLRSDQVYSNPSWISTLDWGKVTGRPSTLAGYGILNAVQNNTTVTINGVGYDLSANRVWSVGTVTSISVTGPLTGGTITGSGTIGITQAGPTTSGYLSSADWNSFNDKIASISALAPIDYSSGVISISQAGASSNGYLSSADWNAFNNKQDAIVNPVTGTGTSGTLPIFTSAGSISDSIISYSGTTLSVGYNSTTGNSFVLSNTGLTAYSYSIVMNNFAILRITTHSYSEGAIIDSIGGNQVRRVFPNGNTVFGVSTVDNGSKLSLYGTLYVDDVPAAAVNTGKFLVSDNGVLKYRTGSQLFSDIGSSREITINGIAQDLSANRSWSVGTVQSVNLTAPVGFTVAGSPVTSSGVIALAFASGYSLPTISSQSSWDSAFNNMIVSAAVTGTTTKTLTLNQQDGGTITASWTESGGGGGTVTLTGNVTGSGTTSITTTIANNVVTNAMLAQIATARIRGRVTAGTGNVEDLTGTQATALLDTFTSSAKGLVPASGGGTSNFLRADGVWGLPPLITANEVIFNNSGSGASSGTSFNGSIQRIISFNTIGAQAASASLSSLAGLTYSSGTPFVKMSAAGTFSLDTNTYLTGNQTITLSGDVSGSGATSISTTIGNNAVTLAKFQQISTSSFLGRVTAGTGDVEVLTGTQATALIDVFTTSLKGLAPASGGGTTNFLRADGTWAAPPGGGGGISGSGTTNAIPIFTGSTTLGNSYITQSSSRINYGTNFGATPHQYHRFFTQNTLANSIGRSSGIDLYATSSSAYSEVRLRPFTDAQLGGGWTHNVVIEAYNGSGNGFQDALRVTAAGIDTIVNINVNGIDVPFGGSTERPATLSLNSGSVNWQFNVTRGNPATNTWMDVREAGTTRMRYISGGRFLLNTTVDNAVDTLQVNGSLIATSLKITGGTSSQVLYADGGVKQITSGTAAPSGGNDGDIYLQYV